jgi:hypothetical protein
VGGRPPSWWGGRFREGGSERAAGEGAREGDSILEGTVSVLGEGLAAFHLGGLATASWGRSRAGSRSGRSCLRFLVFLVPCSWWLRPRARRAFRPSLGRVELPVVRGSPDEALVFGDWLLEAFVPSGEKVGLLRMGFGAHPSEGVGDRLPDDREGESWSGRARAAPLGRGSGLRQVSDVWRCSVGEVSPPLR